MYIYCNHTHIHTICKISLYISLVECIIDASFSHFNSYLSRIVTNSEERIAGITGKS